jgi:hypothetical protein
MTALNDIGLYLEDRGVGELAATLFLNVRPDSPDEVVCLFQYGGAAPEYVQESFSPAVEKPHIQILARSVDADRAEILCYKAWYALVGVTNAVLNGTKYRSIRPLSSPALLGRDANERTMIIFNASVEKEVPVGS